MIFVDVCYNIRTIRVKFGTDVHKDVLSSCDFRVNRRRETLYFSYDVNNITFTRVP
jgi:hypothetical protein